MHRATEHEPLVSLTRLKLLGMKVLHPDTETTNPARRNMELSNAPTRALGQLVIILLVWTLAFLLYRLADHILCSWYDVTRCVDHINRIC